jgi:hypothetical protein|tara:strand:+ start:248 stop:448 length:201 start_codon:yes stop_codon:yes gene_type:complete
MIKGMAEPTPKPAKKSVKILEENEVVPDINVNEEDILQMIEPTENVAAPTKKAILPVGLQQRKTVI